MELKRRTAPWTVYAQRLLTVFAVYRNQQRSFSLRKVTYERSDHSFPYCRIDGNVIDRRASFESVVRKAEISPDAIDIVCIVCTHRLQTYGKYNVGDTASHKWVLVFQMIRDYDVNRRSADVITGSSVVVTNEFCRIYLQNTDTTCTTYTVVKRIIRDRQRSIANREYFNRFRVAFQIFIFLTQLLFAVVGDRQRSRNVTYRINANRRHLEFLFREGANF